MQHLIAGTGIADVFAGVTRLIFEAEAVATDVDQETHYDVLALTHRLQSVRVGLSIVYTPTAVPEPGSLACGSLAAVGLDAFQRRRRWAVGFNPSGGGTLV